MLVHWIWLAERPSVNLRTKWELLQHFSDPEDIFHADADAFEQIQGLDAPAKAALTDHDLSEAGRILERCIENKIHLLTILDRAYPSRLRTIYDPPVLLYYKGTVPDFDTAVGVVGTRHPSVYGSQVAGRMGREIAACGGLVVSGLAAGIDSMAMSGALSVRRPTVGVLGCGVDVVYPKRNKDLFKQVERNGCILSEFAPGTPPARWNFPKRNRIISGISAGVLVIEAPEKSGSLITASSAVEQNRDVFVVPGNLDATGFVGSNRLLRSGAIAVSCGWDVMSEYAYQFPDKVKRADPPETAPEKPQSRVAQQPRIPVETGEAQKEFNKIYVDNGSPEPYIDVNDILTGLTSDERTVVSAITKQEQPVDEIIASVEMSSGKVLAILTMLELKGKIIRHPGKRVSLAAKQI